MSYILDALRKSDQQRQRGAPPPLLALQATAVVPRRRVSISHAVLAALLIGAGIVIGSLRPWQTEQPAPAMAPAAKKPLETSRLLSPPVPPQMGREPEHGVAAQKTPPAARAAAAGATEQRAPAVARHEAKAKPRNKPREAVTAAPETATPKTLALKEMTEKPVPGKPGNAGPGDAAPEPKVMTIAELPLSIQQEMPKMSISVHAYSGTPKDRLLGINDRMLREGDFVAPGLLLEQITPDGVIMSYKGYRFRRGVR